MLTDRLGGQQPLLDALVTAVAELEHAAYRRGAMAASSPAGADGGEYETAVRRHEDAKNAYEDARAALSLAVSSC